jgi:hypothetical protein
VLAGGVGWRCWLAVRRARCLPARRLKLKQNLKLRQNLKDSTQHVRSTQQHTAHSTAAPCSTQRSSTQTTRPVALSRIRSVHQFSQELLILWRPNFLKIILQSAISPSPSHVAQKAKTFCFVLAHLLARLGVRVDRALLTCLQPPPVLCLFALCSWGGGGPSQRCEAERLLVLGRASRRGARETHRARAPRPAPATAGRPEGSHQEEHLAGARRVQPVTKS